MRVCNVRFSRGRAVGERFFPLFTGSSATVNSIDSGLGLTANSFCGGRRSTQLLTTPTLPLPSGACSPQTAAGSPSVPRHHCSPSGSAPSSGCAPQWRCPHSCGTRPGHRK